MGVGSGRGRLELGAQFLLSVTLKGKSRRRSQRKVTSSVQVGMWVLGERTIKVLM